MGGLRKSSNVLSNLGSLSIITGRITVASDVWTLSRNDDTCTLTDIGAADVSIEYGEAFITAPTVIVTTLKGTHEAAVTKHVSIEANSVSSTEFRFHSFDDIGAGTANVTSPDPDNGDGCEFIVVGERAH